VDGGVPKDRVRLDVGGGSNMFYSIIFVGLAFLLIVAVLLQRSRRK
jgi:hypothetical protein